VGVWGEAVTLTQGQFSREVVERRITLIREVLAAKQREYTHDGDPFANFRDAADMDDSTLEQALWGFMLKHLVVVRQMVKSGCIFPRDVWDEKLGDMVNYLILLEGIAYERTLSEVRPEPREESARL
jgi:hypothetical protein